MYVTKDTAMMDSVLKITGEFQDIISLNSMQYLLDSLTILVPQRMVFVKTKKDDFPMKEMLDSHNISYSNIKKDEYAENCYSIMLDNDDALDVSILLYNTGWFEYAEPNFFGTMQLLGYADNPLFSQQWSVHNNSMNIGLLPAWDITTGHDSIKIALLDVGIASGHPDLITNMLPGYSAITQSFGYDEMVNPNESHGTLCAGIMVAANNQEGLVGVAHTSKLMSVKCSEIRPVGTKDYYPTGCDHIYTNHLLDALNTACYVLHADIITIALAIHYQSGEIMNRITNICQNGRGGKGVVFVVSSGNRELGIIDTGMSSLALHPDAISVGSVGPTGLRSQNATNVGWFDFSSCYGDALDLVAPGELIPTTGFCTGGDYSIFAGTSAASAHVAGVAALVLSVNPCFTQEEVAYILESTCKKIRPDTYNYDSIDGHSYGTWNMEVGYGLVDAYAALNLAQQMSGYLYVKDTLVNVNTDWHGNRMINKDLTIDSLVRLSIFDTVFVAKGARIIVRPGGKLVVDGGTITSACSGEMWQGIEVVGNPDKRQIPQWQGVVELKNGATIKNAHCAIRTGLQGDSVYVTTGGIIQADSAFFINNRRSVEFMSYTNHSPAGNVINNQSYFYRCAFTVNDDNLFALNNAPFIDHVTMWAVRGVKFRGCDFRNLTTTSGDRRHAIYTDDAGFSVDDYCSANIYVGCECPGYSKSSTFSGFTTAVEVNTSGHQYSVNVNHAQFTNNGTGVRINGNNYVTVTRNTFNLDSWPSHSGGNVGLYLNTCTGYLVDDNTFERTTYPSGQFFIDNSTGICVAGSGISPNSIHYNHFNNLTKGISVVGTNGHHKWSGLQMTCNDFSGGKHDIYLNNGATVSYVQGSSTKGADNMFSNVTYNTTNFHNPNAIPPISYYYSNSYSNLDPAHYSNLTKTSIKEEYDCSSTLCDNNPLPFSFAGFQSDMNAYTTALANQSPADGTDGGVDETLLETARALSETYYTAVRGLLADTVLDLSELEQWHTAAQPIADPYSLTETRFMMGYSEPFVADADDAELSNYADFHAMKLALRSGNLNDNADNMDNNNSPGINWYALTPAQIAQLQVIAERNAGRASVMAKGVLCFFFGICYDDEWGNAGVFYTPQQGDDTTSTRAKRTAMDAAADAVLNVYPNPTDDILYVELSGTGIKSVGLYDLQGRIVADAANAGGHPAVTFNVRNVPAGVYVLRVTDENGKEYHQKVVVK